MSRPVSLSLPVDESTVATLRSVAHALHGLDLRYVVVGATARDLVLHHLHGLPISRKTTDMGANEIGRKATDSLLLGAFLTGFEAGKPADG